MNHSSIFSRCRRRRHCCTRFILCRMAAGRWYPVARCPILSFPLFIIVKMYSKLHMKSVLCGSLCSSGFTATITKTATKKSHRKIFCLLLMQPAQCCAIRDAYGANNINKKIWFFARRYLLFESLNVKCGMGWDVGTCTYRLHIECTARPCVVTNKINFELLLRSKYMVHTWNEREELYFIRI